MSSLQEAREAIQSGNLTAAQAIIADVLKSDQNNAEAWFLLSEATEGDRKFIFLNKALNLDPNLEEAIERKAQLEGTAEPEPEPESEPESVQEEIEEKTFATIPPANFDDFGDEEEDASEDILEEPAVTVPAVEIQSPPPASPALSPAADIAVQKKEDKKETETEEPTPSNMLNNVGFAFSLALSAVLLILFLRAVMDLF